MIAVRGASAGISSHGPAPPLTTSPPFRYPGCYVGIPLGVDIYHDNTWEALLDCYYYLLTYLCTHIQPIKHL